MRGMRLVQRLNQILNVQPMQPERKELKVISHNYLIRYLQKRLSIQEGQFSLYFFFFYKV